MRYVAALVIASAFTGWPSTQARPDFSGTWAAKKQVIDSAGVTGGTILQIEQNVAVIRIKRTYGRESLKNPGVILTITLDGVESPNPYRMVHPGGISGKITSRAKWNGNRLIIVTTRTMTDTVKKTSYKTESTETLSFDGSQLVVDRVVVSPREKKVSKDIWTRR